MGSLGTHVIEMWPRDGKPLLDFASDLDKAFQFAAWQTKIFHQDAERVTEILASLEQKAFSTFMANLRLVESSSWNFISADEPDPMKKLLARLRSGASVGPVVPALPVKASGMKRASKVREEERGGGGGSSKETPLENAGKTGSASRGAGGRGGPANCGRHHRGTQCVC